MEKNATAAPDAALDTALRRLYQVYEYLRDADLTAESGTARLLQSADLAFLRGRLADELRELAGVAAGTHQHRGLPDDAILEASQVCYWAFVAAVAARLPYAELRPAVCLTAAPAPDPLQAAALGEALALGLCAAPGPPAPADLRAALRQAGLTCRALDVDPRAVVAYDLAQMRARPYLAHFFAADQGKGT